MPISVEGIAEVTRALNTLVRDTSNTIALAVATTIQDAIAPYPPESAANRPRPGYYYVRGKGLFYQSKRTFATRFVRSSETLGRRWRVVKAGRGAVAVENGATYAKYVHGTSERRQARRMARLGWRDTREETKRLLQDGTIDEVLNDVLRGTQKRVGL